MVAILSFLPAKLLIRKN